MNLIQLLIRIQLNRKVKKNQGKITLFLINIQKEGFRGLLKNTKIKGQSIL